jgi:hypothetical protein
MTTWQRFLSSLAILGVACSGSQRVEAPAPAHEQKVAMVARDAANPDAPDVSARDALVAVDAQDWLLEGVRRGQPFFIKRLSPSGTACVEVRFRPSPNDPQSGDVSLGELRAKYLLHHGHLTVSRADGGKDFATGESWETHGVARDGVLLSGALLAISKPACEADVVHRPLALIHERCGEIPTLVRRSSAAPGEMPWLFTAFGLANPCRWAGTYVADGKRYPFEIFPPLGQAWLTGPLAGERPRVADFRVQSGRLWIDGRALDVTPVVVPSSSVDLAPPVAASPDEHDFARDLAAEARTLYIPLLREGQPSCTAIEVSKPNGKWVLPSYSGEPRTIAYVKDDLGVEIGLAGIVKTKAVHGKRRVDATACTSPHVHLTIHGRDAESYHVDGSRWFFDGAACERERFRVLPAMVDLLNVVGDPCAAPDSHLAARPGASLQTGRYFVPRADPTAFQAVDVLAPVRGTRGLAHVEAAASDPEPRSFTFEEIAGGRFLWRTFPNRPGGELLPLLPFDGGVQVDGTRWYRDQPAGHQDRQPTDRH